MRYETLEHVIHAGLIETWDVLKFASVTSGVVAANRLIETWDVLKSEPAMMPAQSRIGLIETWDVLKCKQCFILV